MSKRKTIKARLRAVASAVAIPSVPELDRVVSEKQAAEILNLNYFTLRRLVAAGRAPPRVRLSSARIGYRLSSLYRWLETRTEQPAPP